MWDGDERKLPYLSVTSYDNINCGWLISWLLKRLSIMHSLLNLRRTQHVVDPDFEGYVKQDKQILIMLLNIIRFSHFHYCKGNTTSHSVCDVQLNVNQNHKNLESCTQMISWRFNVSGSIEIYWCPYLNCLVFVSGLNQIWSFSADIHRRTKCQIIMKILPVGSWLINGDRHTDWEEGQKHMRKLTDAFRDCVKSA